MIQQMPAMMNSVMPNVAGNQQTQQASQSLQTPPPVGAGQAQVYIVVENTQAGPFTESELIKLIQNNLLTPETLVWKAGMTAWAAAGQVPDVNKLFILSKIR